MPRVPWSAWAAPCPKRPTKKGEFWEPPRPATPSPPGRGTIQDQEGSDSDSPRRIIRVSDEQERGTGLMRRSPRTHAPPKWRWGGVPQPSFQSSWVGPRLLGFIWWVFLVLVPSEGWMGRLPPTRYGRFLRSTGRMCARSKVPARPLAHLKSDAWDA